MSGWVIDYLGGTYSATFVNLTVTGNLEVDGNFQFGNASVDLLTAVGAIQLQNDINLIFGTTNAAGTAALMQYDTADTNDGFKLGVDETSRHLIVCDYGDTNTDTTLANANNPTLYIFAAAFATTKYLSLTHNGTNGLVTLGTGDTVFSSGLIAGSNGYGINTNLGTQQGISAGGNITIISGASGSGVSIATSTNATSGTSAFFTATSGANTGQTAGSEELIANWDLSATLQFATGSLATQRAFVIKAPTYGFVGASTVTTNVVFQIDKASAAGTNATFTATYLAQWGGSVTIGPSTASQKYGILDVPAHTVTITGTTANTLTTPAFFGASIGVITISDASGVTIANAAGLVVNAPVGGGGGPVTITNTYAIYASGDVLHTNDSNAVFGTTNVAATAAMIQYDTTQTNDALMIGLDETSRSVHLCDYGDINFNFATNSQPSPTLYIHSAANNTTQFSTFANDGTNGVYGVSRGAHTFVQTGQTSGTPNMMTITWATQTGITAATETFGMQLNAAASKGWAAGAGPLATQREVVIQAPTYAGNAGGALTITTAATFAITAAPVQGANMTLTQPVALWVQAGATLLGGILNYVLLTTADNVAYVYTYPGITLLDGQMITFRSPSTETGAGTLNVNGLGAKKMISAVSGVQLNAPTAFVTDGLRNTLSYVAIYSTAADTGTGAWIVSI